MGFSPLSFRAIVTALAVLIVLGGFIFLFSGTSSATEAGLLVDQAKEAMSQAHKVTCGKIGNYNNGCFNGDVEACKKYDAALAYYDANFTPGSQNTCRADFTQGETLPQ